MATVVDVTFNEEPDYQAEVVLAIRAARRARGVELEEWARLVKEERRIGPAFPAALLCYEDGQNMPSADLFLVALALGGLDLRPIIREWRRKVEQGRSKVIRSAIGKSR